MSVRNKGRCLAAPYAIYSTAMTSKRPIRSIFYTALLCVLGLGVLWAGVAAHAQDGATPTPDPDAIVARAREIDLSAYPVVPQPTARTYEIFQQGQALGRAPNVLSKVGDCNSVAWIFLYPFGEDQYDLGDYAELQETVDFFRNSFTQRSHAANNGLNVYAVLDPLWADAAACESGETPLACEYRLRNPSVAVIMFGTNDMLVLTPQQFDAGLRRVVEETAQAGVIPVLSTFPRNLSYPERSVLFNQIVVRVALDEDVPLINLWLALEPLPAHGVDEDGFHLNGPLTRAGDFASADNLRTGHPLRNLVTLQTLDVLRREVLQAPARP